MDRSSAFGGVACADCGRSVADAALVAACPDCGGTLATQYEIETASPDAFPPTADQYRFEPVLPFGREAAVTMGEGATPLVDCSALADEAGTATLLVKDEGANPTGSIADRGASLAVTAVARANAADVVALPTTGHAGRSVAAYAARAGLGSETFLPARAPFQCKAMVNVHGGEMTVVGGRYDDVVDAFERAREPGWADLGPGSPYRREGAVSCYGEILAALKWTAPDAFVVPTGHGTAVAGIVAAAERFRDADLVDSIPGIVVAQPGGCAPVVTAVRDGGAVEGVEHPDTIAGALEVPDPVLGDEAARAARETGGGAESVADEDALAAAVDANASVGVEVGVAGGVGLAAARARAQDEFSDGGTIVVLNPTAGGTESDVLRSHLMGQGV